MKPINIYALTRIHDDVQLSQLERQLSERMRGLKIKPWETDCIRGVLSHLMSLSETVSAYEFYYSFQIPKLGKEFDLLRISDDSVINIELKSGNVSEAAIHKQLLQNRYYLALLGKNIRSYTYVHAQEALYRLTNSGQLKVSRWEDLSADLQKQSRLFTGDLETLFKEEEYLISPLTDPDRFLMREYFLTFQQKDIKANIIKHLKAKDALFQGFTGLPGTGKTLLLYDLAMEWTVKSSRVCVLHFGSFPEELQKLDERLKRIDFYPCAEGYTLPDLTMYEVIFVDEGHRIEKDKLTLLSEFVRRNRIPVVFSYDSEDAIAPEERTCASGGDVEQLKDFVKYRMTNHIRMNTELSSFTHALMHQKVQHRKRFPSVRVFYAANAGETTHLLSYLSQNGYVCLLENAKEQPAFQNTKFMTCKEFDCVAMVMNAQFYYDERAYLRGQGNGVRNLYHGLSRAKAKLAIVVEDNTELFVRVLALLQGNV